jgi:hypothetical protein
MVVMADYTVLLTLIPIGVLIGVWYARPTICGAADIKVLACFLLYNGIALLPLIAIILSSIMAVVHLLVTKSKGTPFCTWLGACGTVFLVINTVITAP